jgi:hypothetical protein
MSQEPLHNFSPSDVTPGLYVAVSPTQWTICGAGRSPRAAHRAAASRVPAGTPLVVHRANEALYRLVRSGLDSGGSVLVVETPRGGLALASPPLSRFMKQSLRVRFVL